MLEGEASLDLSKGDILTTQVDFRANVLRGTYRVLVYLVDRQYQYKDVEISGLASFVVHETTRHAGCAELQPSYRIQVQRPQLTV